MPPTVEPLTTASRDHASPNGLPRLHLFRQPPTVAPPAVSPPVVAPPAITHPTPTSLAVMPLKATPRGASRGCNSSLVSTLV